MDSLESNNTSDVAFILSQKDHLGDDFWTTADNRVGKGSPFSARDASILLGELGLTIGNVVIDGLAERLFLTQRPDGRFKIAPTGTIFPCHTITILRSLCALGYSSDARLQTTFDHLLDIQEDDGGWRCNRVRKGKSDDMDMSNPGVTLEALDAFRHTQHLNKNRTLDRAVDFLLNHWELKRPIGPCYFGIGTLFMQVEYPFLRYNIFYYAYVLSFYERAKKDDRFQEILKALSEKLQNEKMIVENPNRRLARLNMCKKGEPSTLATKRYQEILVNVGLTH